MAKGFAKLASPSILPFTVFTEPSVTHPGLIRLCLGHVQTDQAVILETYYPDEIKRAVRKFSFWLSQHPRAISLAQIHHGDTNACAKVAEAAPTSRSTLEQTRHFRQNPGITLSLTSRSSNP